VKLLLLKCPSNPSLYSFPPGSEEKEEVGEIFMVTVLEGRAPKVPEALTDLLLLTSFYELMYREKCGCGVAAQ